MTVFRAPPRRASTFFSSIGSSRESKRTASSRGRKCRSSSKNRRHAERENHRCCYAIFSGSTRDDRAVFTEIIHGRWQEESTN